MSRESRHQVKVRFADDEHRMVLAEAKRLGLSANQFIAGAAVGRALYERGRRGAPNPYQPGSADEAGSKNRER